MDHLHKEALAFQKRVNDRIDDNSHHIAQKLKQEVQRLEDEIQVKKNPITVENRVKVVIELLEEAGEHEVISHHHVQQLARECEEFQEELRKMR